MAAVKKRKQAASQSNPKVFKTAGGSSNRVSPLNFSNFTNFHSLKKPIRCMIP
jgi:hypothetical protein